MTNSSGSEPLRPFCFINVVWGEKYRNYTLEYCLPSLLAPGNIPAVAGQRPIKFIFASTAADFEIMRGTAVFRELQKYAEPVFIELPSMHGRPYWMHSIVGHKLCCDMIVRERGYRILTGPDAIYSDGLVARLHQLVCDGAEVILSLVTPLMQADRFFQALSDDGLQPQQSRRDTGAPLTLSARQIVDLAMRAMHGQTTVNEWEAPHFCGYVSTPWWRIPGTDGYIMNGTFWDIFLIDYGRVRHDGSTLDERGFDGDYLMRTVGQLETIYFVRDSDEMHVASWASTYEPPLTHRRRGAFSKGIAFRVSGYAPSFNDFQRDALFMPTLVHSGELGDRWQATEQKALQTLATWLDIPRDIERYSRRLPRHLQSFAGLQAKIAACPLPWWRRDPLIWSVIRHGLVPLARLWIGTKVLLVKAGHARGRIALALRGDAASIDKLRWRVKRLWAKALGRPFT